MSDRSMDLYYSMKKTAEKYFNEGTYSSYELYERAAEEARTGFSISADYTKLLASMVARLERGEEP